MDCVAVEVHCDVDRLIPETHDASRTTAKGHRPHASAGGVIPRGRFACGLTMPVRGDDRRGGQIPTLLHVVVDEVLQQHLVYRRAVSGTGNGPDVVDQRTYSPLSRLDQRDS